MSMEMLFAVIGGLFLALAVHFLLPHRDLRGSALLAAIGTAVTAVVWSALTWLGWPFDGGWIWVVSLLASPLVATAVGLALPSRRSAADERLFASLAKG
ncbi:hypothetical protein OH146_12120 [Salinibacterium sp. SYSU T00001]|uniref:hypothetical protein n=1 Tax=Homoserinimonas sedimenticola TaxID=2986805 RepID=UPI0022365668|nr:hypothetical protein [Salinibacterium sedimenticola]MCW4386520.1 hypothetical protein [Salinibacterium sedimenticola]